MLVQEGSFTAARVLQKLAVFQRAPDHLLVEKSCLARVTVQDLRREHCQVVVDALVQFVSDLFFQLLELLREGSCLLLTLRETGDLRVKVISLH